MVAELRSGGCIFCRIVQGLVPAHKVYEDERVLAFLDIHPSASGHTLVVPKAHVTRVQDLSEDDAAALFRALHRLVAHVQAAVGGQASTIGINNGPESGQEVPHVHVHVIPRSRDDHGGIVQALGRRGFHQREEEMPIIAAKIRELLARKTI